MGLGAICPPPPGLPLKQIPTETRRDGGAHSAEPGILGGSRIWRNLPSTMEMQNPWSQIGVLESLDDARAFGVVFGDIFKGKYKLKRMGCYISASNKSQNVTFRSI